MRGEFAKRVYTGKRGQPKYANRDHARERILSLRFNALQTRYLLEIQQIMRRVMGHVSLAWIVLKHMELGQKAFQNKYIKGVDSKD